MRRGQRCIPLDHNRHVVVLLDSNDLGAFAVHQVIGDGNRRPHQDLGHAPLCPYAFDVAQNRQCHIAVRSQQARAMTLRTLLGYGFHHPRAHALARHLQKAEFGNTPHTQARPIGF